MMTADRRKKHCCTNKAIPTSSPNGVQILRTVEMKGSKWQSQKTRTEMIRILLLKPHQK